MPQGLEPREVPRSVNVSHTFRHTVRKILNLPDTLKVSDLVWRAETYEIGNLF